MYGNLAVTWNKPTAEDQMDLTYESKEKEWRQNYANLPKVCILNIDLNNEINAINEQNFVNRNMNNIVQ